MIQQRYSLLEHCPLLEHWSLLGIGCSGVTDEKTLNQRSLDQDRAGAKLRSDQPETQVRVIGPRWLAVAHDR